MTLALEFIFGGAFLAPPSFYQDMKIYITCIYLVIAVILIKASVSYAQETTPSATIKQTRTEQGYDYRVLRLKTFLESYDSPLSVSAADFVAYADFYNLDYRLVPAITGVESTFGKRIPLDSYNAYGWANGNYKFESWQDSIATVSSTLKTKYLDRGISTVNKIGRVYAPPSSTWAGKVKYFMYQIDPIPVSYDI